VTSVPTSRLRLLAPRADVLERQSHPWTPWFDKVFGLGVRASNATEARKLAQSRAGDEGLGLYRRFVCTDDELVNEVWLDSNYTDCEVLAPEGPEAVILIDRREA
jgi:hypothetical protein